MSEPNPQMTAMAGPATGNPKSFAQLPDSSSNTTALICIALATVAVHLLTGGRYGFHRDELATLDDARHLAWGTLLILHSHLSSAACR